MNFSILVVLEMLLVLGRLNSLLAYSVPLLRPTPTNEQRNDSGQNFRYLPFVNFVEGGKDTSEFWRETDIISLVKFHHYGAAEEECSEKSQPIVRFPSRRTIRPICHSSIDHQLCPQCPQFNNFTECELFRDSCKERRVSQSERKTYCERKYGKWRAMLIPADYSECRCCDECVFYRELDQSCKADEYSFDTEEFLPVTSIDFRAGCNPYWGHPEQELRALRCDQVLRRCVPVASPVVKEDARSDMRRTFRFEKPDAGKDCPETCRGYHCKDDKVDEDHCRPGAFLPDKDFCNCCGRCSFYRQLNEKCAEFKKTVHDINGTKETEVEEEFLHPGCDDGLVCRKGFCQDIHAVRSATAMRRKRDESDLDVNEPCKRELKLFKKKYGPEGHLHYDAPQCTPLWLYAPVQCHRFVCYCSLEDGTMIRGIKVPRVEVSNMNCDCAREKCRTGSDVECDGYGNYREAVFTQRTDDLATPTPTHGMHTAPTHTPPIQSKKGAQ